MLKKIVLLLVLCTICAVSNAQIDKTGYSLVYSSETAEAASLELSLTDEEKANCTGDFLSTANFERNWLYCPRQTSKWNKRMALNDEDRAKVHICEDGKLRMLALSLDGTAGNCITSGIKMKQGYKYGIFEIKAKCNPHKSNFPAVWMMPSNPKGGWPDCGEIDIMEQIGTSSTVYSTVHLGARYNDPVGKSYSYSGSKWFDEGYHIYSLLWTKTCLTFYCDGKQILQYSKDNTLDLVNHPKYEHAQFPYNEEFYIILDQALGCNAWWGNEEPDPNYTYEMDVDYVRIFQAPEEEEVLDYYVIQNVENPTFYMTSTAKGLACSEALNKTTPDPSFLFCFPSEDYGTKKFIRNKTGQYVTTANISNKQITFAEVGTPYNIIRDSDKGVAFDCAMTNYPLTYSDGSRAIIHNPAKGNIASVSGTSRATAWWKLINLEELAAGITNVIECEKTAKVRKVVRGNQLLIQANGCEYTMEGIRIR